MTSSNGRGLTISGPGAHNVGSSGTAETGRVQSLSALSIAPLVKWTGDDSEFATRIARSAQRLGANDSASFHMFIACAEQWGPRSAPALGCLLAMVREAWAKHWAQSPAPTRPLRCRFAPVVTVERVHPGGWRWRLQAFDEFGQVGTSGLGDIVPTEAEAGVAALDAAP